MLYPQTNDFRLALRLDGVWDFRKDPRDEGVSGRWFSRQPSGVIPMPVPSAFNEMTADPDLRDYFGAAWYFTTFTAPRLPASGRCVLRFGAAAHHAAVWLNGEAVGGASLGRLPFECDATTVLRPGENFLAVRVDTRLTWQTIPPGQVKEVRASCGAPHVHGAESSPRPEYHFDFLNYGGLLRSVWLLALPENHLAALRVETLADGDTPVGLRVSASRAGNPAIPVYFSLRDASGAIVAEAPEGGELRPSRPEAWSPESPVLYLLEARLGGPDQTFDLYSLPVGLRTVRVTPDAFLLNGKPVRFRGCGLHEDFPLLGHGHSDARLVRDLTMLKNMGANSFRTSHYPYDESAYQLADRLGLLVIDETPAVGLNAWSAYPVFTQERCNQTTLGVHLDMIERLVARDHHHPCVVMWSLANEPACHEPAAEPYFEALFERCRAVDPQRLPVTVVLYSTPPGASFLPEHNSRIARFCDVIVWNRYYAWYENHSHLGDIVPQLLAEAGDWRAAHPDKPLFLGEFGADAVAGIHSDPPLPFSEEYQAETIRLYAEALDRLPFVIGEHVWNLCDFMTKPGLNRVLGNRKGIHTRDRQPKLAAHFLKARWHASTDPAFGIPAK